MADLRDQHAPQHGGVVSVGPLSNSSSSPSSSSSSSSMIDTNATLALVIVFLLLALVIFVLRANRWGSTHSRQLHLQHLQHAPHQSIYSIPHDKVRGEGERGRRRRYEKGEDGVGEAGYFIKRVQREKDFNSIMFSIT